MQGGRMLQRNSNITRQLFVRFLVPSILSLFANSVNLFINTAIVGNYVPGVGLAAMSLVAPVTLLYYTVGSTISVGAAVCFSSAVGTGDYQKARDCFGYAIIAILGAGLLFTAVLLPLSSRIAVLLGASGDLVAPVNDYLFYYFLGGSFTMFLYIPLNFAKALGKPNIPLVLLTLMGTVNVVLTWTFVAVLGRGVGGASLATVISLFVATAVGSIILFRNGGDLRPHFTIMDARDRRLAIKSGSASGLNNLARFCTVYGMNTVITLLAAGELLGTYSIARSTQDMFLCIVLGVSQSIMPLIAMFSGEKDNFAIRAIVRGALEYGLAIMGGCVILVVAFSGQIVQLFGSVTTPANRIAIICMTVTLLPSLVNNVLSAHYSSTGRYRLSLLTLALRVVLTVGLCYLLGSLLGANLLWLGFPIGELLTFLLMLLVVRGYSARHDDVVGTLLLPRKNDAIENLKSFSIAATAPEATDASERIVSFLEERGMPVKASLKTGLAVEEVIVALETGSRLKETDQVDVRVFYDTDGTVIRFRFSGRQYNPLASADTATIEDDEFGIRLIKMLAKETDYRWLFGMNNLTVII